MGRWQVEGGPGEEGGIPSEHHVFHVGGDVVAEANRTGRSGSAIRKLSDGVRTQGDIVDRDICQSAREVAGCSLHPAADYHRGGIGTGDISVDREDPGSALGIEDSVDIETDVGDGGGGVFL